MIRGNDQVKSNNLIPMQVPALQDTLQGKARPKQRRSTAVCLGLEYAEVLQQCSAEALRALSAAASARHSGRPGCQRIAEGAHT